MKVICHVIRVTPSVGVILLYIMYLPLIFAKSWGHFCCCFSASSESSSVKLPFANCCVCLFYFSFLLSNLEVVKDDEDDEDDDEDEKFDKEETDPDNSKSDSTKREEL